MNLIEYHVIGKVEDFEYIITTPIRQSMLGHSYVISKLPCKLEDYIKSYYSHRKDSDCCYLSNIDKIEGILELKRNILNLPILNTIGRFKEYKEYGIIQSEREFQNGDIITIEDKDYIVKYKYNIKSNAHELYIDYIFTDTELEKQSLNSYSKLWGEILEINNKIEKEIKQVKLKNKDKSPKKIY